MRIAIVGWAAMLVLAGCQKDERGDAARLEKALTDVQADATAASTLENDVVNRARPWCGGMAAAGAGHDADLDRNTTMAGDFARQAQTASDRWEAIRKTLAAQRLRAEHPRSVRSNVTAQISKHLAALEELRTSLADAVTQFKAFAQDRTYSGDTVPPVVTNLDHILGRYDPASDEVTAALSELRTRYGQS
jgi:hypothetical protein